jgi:hypothetical protein
VDALKPLRATPSFHDLWVEVEAPVILSADRRNGGKHRHTQRGCQLHERPALTFDQTATVQMTPPAGILPPRRDRTVSLSGTAAVPIVLTFRLPLAARHGPQSR